MGTPPQITILQDWIQSAQSDPAAEASLRDLISRVSSNAPLSAVIEIGQTLLDIRQRDLRRAVEAN